MRELYESRFSKQDPYDLCKSPEAKIINDYKIDLLRRIFPPWGTYRRSLDVGCGDAGIFLSHPQCRGIEFSVSLDLSLEATKSCRDHHLGSKTPTYFVVGDAQNLPFADDIFDFVYCSEVLEHLPEAHKGVDELYRVLQPKGEAVVSAPNEEEYVVCPSEHVSNFTYYSFKSLLAQRFEITLEKGLYLNEVHPRDLIRTTHAERRFQELLRLGESHPEGSFVCIFKVQPLWKKGQPPPDLPLAERAFAHISPRQLASHARIGFPYQIESKRPLFGPLIAWVRRNLTSHLKEPYIDRMALRQTNFNLLIAGILGRLVQALEGSLNDTAEEVLSASQKQQELEDQIGELRVLIEQSHRQLKEEIAALETLVRNRDRWEL